MPRHVRRRYLALRVLSEQSISKRDVMDAVWNAFLQLFGEHGASQTNLTFIEYNSEKSCGIVRCSHKTVEMVRASIASITEINGKPVAIDILGVSGTLKALREKVLL
ncbi:MAG: ribonuclease P protein component 2 [Candidatus Bathyarchaeota archaeon]|nr:MAG: ribonuclease P protein component 2 [Candidatus Bathyarchaeota archaeon]